MTSFNDMVAVGLVAIVLITAIVMLAVYLWISNSRYAGREEMRESSHRAHERIDDLHGRCITVEARIESLPTHADLRKVVEAVGRIGGDVRNMQGQMGGISTQLLRVEKSLDALNEIHIKEP